MTYPAERLADPFENDQICQDYVETPFTFEAIAKFYNLHSASIDTVFSQFSDLYDQEAALHQSSEDYRQRGAAAKETLDYLFQQKRLQSATKDALLAQGTDLSQRFASYMHANGGENFHTTIQQVPYEWHAKCVTSTSARSDRIRDIIFFSNKLLGKVADQSIASDLSASDPTISDRRYKAYSPERRTPANRIEAHFHHANINNWLSWLHGIKLVGETL